MERDFSPGDTVVVDPTKQPSPGDYVAASVNRGPAQIAKYRLISSPADSEAVFELVPLNSFFPDIRSDKHDKSLLGRCMQRLQHL